MKWLGDKFVAAERQLRGLPASARRWLTILAVPALALGVMIGTFLGPGPIGATVLPSLLPSASTEVPTVTAGDGLGDGAPASVDSAPTLGAPAGNVAPPPAPAATPAPALAPGPAATPAPAPVEDTPTPGPAPADEPDDPYVPSTPPGADTETENAALAGTVVRVNPAARSYVIADSDGTMSSVHTAGPPEVGETVEATARQLANNTYGQVGDVKARAGPGTAKVAGTVTYTDAAEGAYAVSSRGASVLVHVGDDAATPTDLPALGTQVTVSATVSTAPVLEAVELPFAAGPGEAPEPSEAPTPLCTSPADTMAPEPPPAPESILVERSRKEGDDPLAYSDFEGVVQAACTKPSVLVISADDIRESGADLRISVPKDLKLPILEAGQAVDATAEIDRESGELELAGLSSDTGTSGADNTALTVGDQSG